MTGNNYRFLTDVQNNMQLSPMSVKISRYFILNRKNYWIRRKVLNKRSKNLRRITERNWESRIDEEGFSECVVEMFSYFIYRLVLCLPWINSKPPHSKCVQKQINSELYKCKSHLACGQYQRSILRPAMPFRKFRPKFSIYQVCVTILEAKYLPQNANPLVVVKVGNRKRRTVVRKRTDNPIYNEVKLSSPLTFSDLYKTHDSRNYNG